MATVLVPLRYPITARGERTLEKALEVLKQNSPSLVIYHVNLLYDDLNISNKQLQREVEEKVPEFRDYERIAYAVENSYLLDESILKKISYAGADVVIMGETMISRWRKFLKFWGAYKISDEIKKAAGCKVIVVE